MEYNHSNINGLRDLLIHNIQALINAEMQLKNVIPGWIDKTSSLKMKMVLQKYLELIQMHVEKLDHFLGNEKVPLFPGNNAVMDAFIHETNALLAKCTDAEVKDAGLLACVQNINHFKISNYGTSAAFTNTLEMEEAAVAFREAEINEKQIDDRLSQLAEHEINVNARDPIILTR
jgi:ferritin-like metal-binding protein YciE